MHPRSGMAHRYWPEVSARYVSQFNKHPPERQFCPLPT